MDSKEAASAAGKQMASISASWERSAMVAVRMFIKEPPKQLLPSIISKWAKSTRVKKCAA
jgi:hypothetical protein